MIVDGLPLKLQKPDNLFAVYCISCFLSPWFQSTVLVHPHVATRSICALIAEKKTTIYGIIINIVKTRLPTATVAKNVPTHWILMSGPHFDRDSPEMAIATHGYTV